jgi:GTPase Era involved in 16S rRNA processing
VADPLRLAATAQKEEAGAGRRLAVAVLGVPNSGKSTLVNQLVGHFVCPHSVRDNTTLRNTRWVYVTDHGSTLLAGRS